MSRRLLCALALVGLSCKTHSPDENTAATLATDVKGEGGPQPAKLLAPLRQYKRAYVEKNEHDVTS